MTGTTHRLRHIAPSRFSPGLGGLAVAVGFVVCWSSGFVGSRLAVAIDTPVLALYAWRFALATLLAGGWWWWRSRRRTERGLNRRALAHEALVGSLTVGGYLLTMLLAVKAGVSAEVAALIGALQPLAAITLASSWLGEHTRPLQWLGMTVATLGAALSVMDDLQGVGGAPLWAYGMPLLAVACVTLGSALTARQPVALPLEARLTAQLTAATGVFFLAALGMGSSLAPPAPSLDTLTALAWLIVLATFGGYGFFVESLRRFGVGHSAGLIALTPAVTLAWTALMFGELPGTQGAAGMLLGLIGASAALYAGRQRGRGAGGHGDTASPAGRRSGRPAIRPTAPASTLDRSGVSRRRDSESDPRHHVPSAPRGPRTW
ncbi:DMT family transporter [Halomonas eurihalina]|uniref:DMT family transporter n=1 Tax=Halomonas eurihalina TaxID=42566 RepID=A0A5D9CWD7_HALER|nr:DMT family transporter [Halomonas eurihalina]MDR5861009.1 DMT family transporter [Halomonas eurihalina]TZG35667.1 DMT family transporter [Halomonas eurihalina]